MGEPQRGKGERVSERIPEFWIRPQDKRGRPLDPRVYTACLHLWPSAYRHVEIELHDGAAPLNFWRKLRWRFPLGCAPTRKWKVT